MANDFKRMWTKEELKEFLQIRLDKPSKVIENVISEQDYFELFNSCRVGSIVKFYSANLMESGFSYKIPCFGIVTEKHYKKYGDTYTTYITINMISMLFFSNPNYFQIRFERDTLYEDDPTDLYMYYHTNDEIDNVSFSGGVLEPDDESHPLHNQPVIKNISVF